MSRILIVDDEAIITMQLEERLTEMGYTVAGMAASGEAAIQKARKERPDIVLMDIVMPGKLNGIDAAKVITEELGIPVVFVTSYADDTIIGKAKSVRPSGYIVKPFNEREVKAAIEVALFRKSFGAKTPAKETEPATAGIQPAAGSGIEGEKYLDLSRDRTVLLDGFPDDLVLFLYTDPLAKEPVFHFAIEEGLRKGGYNLFAYTSATVQRHFAKEIQAGQLHTQRLKKDGIPALVGELKSCIQSLPSDPQQGTLRVLLDVSDSSGFDDAVVLKEFLIAQKAGGIPVAGILAVDIGDLDHDRIASLARDIPRVIVASGRDTAISFARHTFAPDSVEVVPQDTVDDIVRKSLEPVVLSLLERPISGFDIVHEIHNRYRVLIPQARVYSLLYDLQEKGYLEIRISGKSKLYCMTEAGRRYIPSRLAAFRSVYRHILGEDVKK